MLHHVTVHVVRRESRAVVPDGLPIGSPLRAPAQDHPMGALDSPGSEQPRACVNSPGETPHPGPGRLPRFGLHSNHCHGNHIPLGHHHVAVALPVCDGHQPGSGFILADFTLCFLPITTRVAMRGFPRDTPGFAMSQNCPPGGV